MSRQLQKEDMSHCPAKLYKRLQLIQENNSFFFYKYDEKIVRSLPKIKRDSINLTFLNHIHLLNKQFDYHFYVICMANKSSYYSFQNFSTS